MVAMVSKISMVGFDNKAVSMVSEVSRCRRFRGVEGFDVLSKFSKASMIGFDVINDVKGFDVGLQIKAE